MRSEFTKREGHSGGYLDRPPGVAICQWLSPKTVTAPRGDLLPRGGGTADAVNSLASAHRVLTGLTTHFSLQQIESQN